MNISLIKKILQKLYTNYINNNLRNNYQSKIIFWLHMKSFDSICLCKGYTK